MGLLETIQTQLDEYGQELKALLEDGVQIRDLYAAVTGLAARAIIVAEEFGGTGAEKKEAVLSAVAAAYDKWIAPLNLPGPDWLLDPIIKNVLVDGLGLVIDILVAQFKTAKEVF